MQKALKILAASLVAVLALSLGSTSASGATTYSKTSISKVAKYTFPAATRVTVTQFFDLNLDNAKRVAPLVKNQRASSTYDESWALKIKPTVKKTYVTNVKCPSTSKFKTQSVCKQIATDVTITVSGGYVPALVLGALKLVGIDVKGNTNGRVITIVDPAGTTSTSWKVN